MNYTTNNPQKQISPNLDLPTLAGEVADILGVQTFPVVGKKPPRGYRWGWKSGHFQTTPGVQTLDPKWWETATGYGITALPGSDLYIIDVDMPEFTELLYKTLPVLQTSLIVEGAPGHLHIYVRLGAVGEIRRLQIQIGDQEAASLRGHSSYVVGPGSLHPETGSRYRCDALVQPIKLSSEETQELLKLFQSEPAPQKGKGHPPPNNDMLLYADIQPRIIYRPGQTQELDDLFGTLRKKGYKPNKDWLNGQCIHPEQHHNKDASPSFGVNLRSGVGHCFACGNFSPNEVAQAFDVRSGSVRALHLVRRCVYPGDPIQHYRKTNDI